MPEREDGGNQGEIEGGFAVALRNGGGPPGASYSGVESVCVVVAVAVVYDKREFPNISAPECEAA